MSSFRQIVFALVAFSSSVFAIQERGVSSNFLRGSNFEAPAQLNELKPKWMSTDVIGQNFLAMKLGETGVKALPSGMLYKVLEKGTGSVHPTAETKCLCNYEGKLVDGTKFDSSYDRGQPLEFAPNQVIKGWTEAMQLMVEGDKWEMYIPSELAYGESGAGSSIPGNAALVFQMKLEKIEG